MKPRRRFFSCLLLVAGLPWLAPSQSNATVVASSDFSANIDGWTLTGDPSSTTPTHFAAGGNPGGYIQGADAVLNNTWYFNAPAKFLGNVSAAYGGALTFDQRANGFFNAPFNWDDIVLTSPALTLFFDITAPMPQIIPWTSYSVPLAEGPGWSLGGLGTGGMPTQAQFVQVLSNLTGLQIRGEFFSGFDTSDLDNVALITAIPEASLLPLMGLALGALIVRAFIARALASVRWTI
jgi:alkaline phosphatase D